MRWTEAVHKNMVYIRIQRGVGSFYEYHSTHASLLLTSYCMYMFYYTASCEMIAQEATQQLK